MLLQALLTVVIWGVGGGVMGALANAARWGVGAFRPDLPYSWLLTLGWGIGGGIVGGYIGSLFFSELFGFPSALAFGAVILLTNAWRLQRDNTAARTTGENPRQGT